MVLFEQERRTKLKTVADALGFGSIFPLINAYQEKEIVPGICTRFDCNYITNVDRNEERARCGNCHHQSVQSILLIARLL
jgi:hypothetical protein